MNQWRKDCDLQETMQRVFVLDVSDSFCSVDLEVADVEKLLNNYLSADNLYFFRHLIRHMNRNISYDDHGNMTHNYTYSYQADW